MCHDQLNYVERMRALGYRVTPQRQLILDAVCAGQGHTTLEEIAARVYAKAPTLNRATVYRTLDFLVRLRLVVAIQCNGQSYYEIAGVTPHHHLICRACGKTEELDNALVDELSAAVQARHHFRLDMDHIALLGLCRQCKRKPVKS